MNSSTARSLGFRISVLKAVDKEEGKNTSARTIIEAIRRKYGIPLTDSEFSAAINNHLQTQKGDDIRDYAEKIIREMEEERGIV